MLLSIYINTDEIKDFKFKGNEPLINVNSFLASGICFCLFILLLSLRYKPKAYSLVDQNAEKWKDC